MDFGRDLKVNFRNCRGFPMAKNVRNSFFTTPAPIARLAFSLIPALF
jgi:hypothetical protein